MEAAARCSQISVTTKREIVKRNALLAARDVPAGQSWAFVDHRTMEEVIATEQAARRGAVHAALVVRRMVDMPTLYEKLTKLSTLVESISRNVYSRRIATSKPWGKK